LLLISLVLIILSFLSGNNSDSLGILALATAMITHHCAVHDPVVALPGIHANCWLAWTGDSRTGIDANDTLLCGDERLWRSMLEVVKRSAIKSTPFWTGYGLAPIPCRRYTGESDRYPLICKIQIYGKEHLSEPHYLGDFPASVLITAVQNPERFLALG